MILINPPNSSVDYNYPPLGTLYLASALEKAGKSVSVLHWWHIRRYEKQFSDAIRNHKEVGISTNVFTASQAKDLARFIRQHFPEKRIIMGGPYATVMYEKLIPDYADIVVLGEGEETIVELAAGRNLNEIKGIAYWNGAIKINQPQKLIENLDSIPIPAYHLVDLKKYRFVYYRALPFAAMITSRGCPYQCITCTKVVHGNKLRLRSLQNVMQELDYLVNRFGVREIHFWDDMFNFYPERVKELCRLIINQKYKKLRFAFPNALRADKGDLEMYQLMAKAGTYSISIAAESGVQDIVNKIGKGLNLTKVKDSIKMARSVGIRTIVYFMLGLPWDTRLTMENTSKFAKSLRSNGVSFFIAHPFPGTRLYEIVKKEGKFIRNTDDDCPGYGAGKAVYEIYSLKKEDVELMYKKAYLDFYLKPQSILNNVLEFVRFPKQYVSFTIRAVLRFLFKCYITKPNKN